MEDRADLNYQKSRTDMPEISGWEVVIREKWRCKRRRHSHWGQWMSGLKQHRQEVRQNHGKSMACVAVALGCLSKPAQTKQSPVGAALCFLGIHGIQLLLVVAFFIKCKITHRPFFNVNSCAIQSFWGKIYIEIWETPRDADRFRAEMEKSSSNTHPSSSLLKFQHGSHGNPGIPLHQSSNWLQPIFLKRWLCLLLLCTAACCRFSCPNTHRPWFPPGDEAKGAAPNVRPCVFLWASASDPDWQLHWCCCQ